jgi:hypothetical protein
MGLRIGIRCKDRRGPFVINEDVAIKPNGRALQLGAATVAEFAGWLGCPSAVRG